MSWHSEEKPLPVIRSVVEQVTTFEDENPPHPIIWEGSLKSLDYYLAITKNNRKIAFPASLFEDPEPSPPPASSSSLPSPPVAPRSSSNLPARPGPARTTHLPKNPVKPCTWDFLFSLSR